MVGAGTGHVPVGIADRLQLDLDGATQVGEAVLEEIGVRLTKLVVHHTQVLDRESQQLTLVLALDGELPLQLVSE